LYRRLVGPQGRYGQVRKISPPPGLDPRTVQPVAVRYTDYAVPADHISLCEYLEGYPITDMERLLMFQEFDAPKISKQSAHEVGKVVSPRHRPPLYPQKTSLVLISVRG